MGEHAGTGRGRLRWIAVFFFGSILVYSANLREFSAVDTVPTRMVAVALVRDGTLVIDSYFAEDQREQDLPWRGQDLPWWVVHKSRGHYWSVYPPMPAILAAPVYFVPIRVFGRTSWSLVTRLAKVSATLVAALSVVLVYATIRRIAGESPARWLTVAYALGTSTWTVSSQGLWGHGSVALFVALACYLTARGWPSGPVPAVALGLVCGLMISARLSSWPIAITFVAYTLRWAHDWRVRTRVLIPFVAVVVSQMVFNHAIYGSVIGGYSSLGAIQGSLHGGAEGLWSAGVGKGLLGLLVSPSRGLFVYSPVLLFAIVGGFRVGRCREYPFLRYVAAGVAGSLLMLGTYPVWWGGWSFGPRYLTDLTPLLVLLIVPAWNTRWMRSAVGRGAFRILLGVSIAIQAVGAFYHPSKENDWNETPEDVDKAHYRLWDWKDSQLSRLLSNGPLLWPPVRVREMLSGARRTPAP